MNYVFVCIGTNKLIEDSFGPRVGEILNNNFNDSHIRVLGTMENPIHFQNAPIFLDYLKQEQSLLIVIDSALGEEKQIGNTYINFGGIEIGKAFGKSFYFPASLSIKTVVGVKPKIRSKNVKFSSNIRKIGNIDEINKMLYINKLAQSLANQILCTISEII